MQAVGLLQDMGYLNVGHYAGGIEEWMESGASVESGPPVSPPRDHTSVPVSRLHPRRLARPTARLARSFGRRLQPVSLIERLADSSYRALLGLWLGIVLGFGVLYWLWIIAGFNGLYEAGTPVMPAFASLATALYFSAATATSIGFGDVVPMGLVRLLAMIEGATGLLIFGCLISKLVSRRQEELAEETHRIAFDERLGRLRTNLHLVLSELQIISRDWMNAASPPERTLSRLESATIVFSGELRTVHDLLYRPQELPQETVFEGLLASLAANLGELRMLLEQIPEASRRSDLLAATLQSLQVQAGEICGQCVPREYAPELKVWMDRIQDLARRLTPSS